MLDCAARDCKHHYVKTDEPCALRVSVCLSSRDTRTGKTLAVVVAIDKTDDLAKAGFLGEPDFTPSDRRVKSNRVGASCCAVLLLRSEQHVQCTLLLFKCRAMCKFSAAPCSTACFNNTFNWY